MTQEDIGSHLHYDEQVALENYVLRNYAHLLSPEERVILDGGLAQWWEENLERMHEWGAHTRVSRVAPPWEPAPLDTAHAETVRSIVKQLQGTHGDSIRIVSCPTCARIVRGPDDAMCPWCRAVLSPPV